MKARVLRCVLFCVLIGVLPTRAALIVYDGFNYTANQGIEGQGGGTGWGGAVWYDNSNNGINNNATSPGFSYSTLPVQGNKVTTAGGNNGSFRYLGLQAGSGTYYVSFIVQRVTGSSSGYGGVSLFSGDGSEHFFIGQRNDQSTFGIQRSGGPGGNSGTAASTLSFLVMKIVMNGSSSSASLFVNPTLGVEPGSADVSINNVNAFSFDTIRIQSGNTGNPTFAFDELRIGTSYSDVAPVPEPVNVALTIFGFLIVFAHWQKRMRT